MSLSFDQFGNVPSRKNANALADLLASRVEPEELDAGVEARVSPPEGLALSKVEPEP